MPDNVYVIIWKVFILLVTVFYFFELPIYVMFGEEFYVHII